MIRALQCMPDVPDDHGYWKEGGEEDPEPKLFPACLSHAAGQDPVRCLCLNVTEIKSTQYLRRSPGRA